MRGEPKRFLLLLVLGLVAAPAEAQECPAGPPVEGRPALATELVVTGLERPVGLASLPDDPRLFVVEQRGRVRILRRGALEATPFLDLAGRVDTTYEGGLLGLAFHPEFATNGRLFVNYTAAGSGETRIAELRLRPDDPDRADPESEVVLLAVPQPFENHNGGALAFGPDGHLYAALGDGGAGGDPRGAGQRLDTPLGKILRLDVDAGVPFAVPLDNPFLDRPGAFPAIWALGLRNPWRISFDPATGDLYIGDVGQAQVEEIDVGLAAAGGGENYGWNVREGSLCFSPSLGCPSEGLTPPVLEYDHSDGSCAVIGGVVYRGCRMPGWAGTYFYADACSGFVRSFRLEGVTALEPLDWTLALSPNGELTGATTFGVDAAGEVYVATLSGALYRLIPDL